MASAFGCSYASPFSYSWQGIEVPVPSGYLCHTVTGRGRRIDTQMASYQISTGIGGLAGRICNWRIDFEYLDVANRAYAPSYGEPHTNGCTMLASRTIKPRRVFQAGRTCARLYVNGILRTSHCHSITN